MTIALAQMGNVPHPCSLLNTLVLIEMSTNYGIGSQGHSVLNLHLRGLSLTSFGPESCHPGVGGPYPKNLLLCLGASDKHL